MLPDDALVVRGGKNLPESFAKASEAKLDDAGKIHGVSVNSAAGKSVEELTMGNTEAGYPGIPDGQIGVTTVGTIRAAGGLTPEKASELFRPTRANPNRQEG